MPSKPPPAAQRHRVVRGAGWLPLALISLAFLLAGSPSSAFAEKTVSCAIADGFDYPVGIPNASGYYKARGFWPNGHLGEDWNGRGGGNTDLGDPVYAIANGVVVYSDDFKLGWGNVVIVRHAYREKNGRVYFVDSLYGHLHRRDVRLYQTVRRGQQLGTIGQGPGRMYYAHLHFEIRKNLAIGMNRSKYPRDYSCYHSPTHFIDANRKLRSEFRRVRIPVDTFLKSNPNSLTVAPAPSGGGSSSLPNLSGGGRPQAPEPVRQIITARGSDDEERDTRGFWSRVKGRLSGGRGVDPTDG